MKTISAGLSAHLGLATTSITTICRVTRKDNSNFYFTEHDADIRFDDGDGEQTYKAETGYIRTAITNRTGLSVGNMDLTGIFSSDGFLENELRAGLFDNAEIKFSVVNWKDLTNGALKLRRGTIGEVNLSSTGIFVAELRGLTSPLSQTIVTRYQAECRTNVGSATCMVPIKKPALTRNLPVLAGEIFIVPTLPLTGINFSNIANNPVFVQDTAEVDIQSINSWEIIAGKWDITATIAGLAPYFGGQFLHGGETATQSHLRQDTDLSLFGLNLAAVDAGNVTVDFSVQRANSDVDDTGRVLVTFLDAAKAPIGTCYDSGTEEISPIGAWVARGASSVTLPTTTRHIRVDLFSNLVTGIQQNSAFDGVDMTLADLTTTNTFFDVHEDRLYRCVTAGTTGGTIPAYDKTLGNLTTDGTAVFIAQDAWTRAATITEIIDRVTMRIEVSDARAVDGWFNYGSVYIESGPNAGLVREVKAWSATGGLLELFIETPLQLYPGTKIKLYRGCDRRSSTCRGVFNNIINFQGEPFALGRTG